MNFDTIINEELDEARERIKARMTQMLMGGDSSPAPRGYTPPTSPRGRQTHSDFSNPPITLPATNRAAGARTGNSHNAQVARQTYDDVETFVAFVREHPGCLGHEIIAHLGCQVASDRRYVNVTKAVRKSSRVMTKGSGRMQVYYVNEKPGASQPTPPGQSKGMGRGGNRNPAPKIKDPVTRDNKLVDYVKSHPGLTSPELRDHFAGKPEMGTAEALMSAIHRLTVKGRLKKKMSKKLGHRNQPIVELRVK